MIRNKMHLVVREIKEYESSNLNQNRFIDLEDNEYYIYGDWRGGNKFEQMNNEYEVAQSAKLQQNCQRLEEERYCSISGFEEGCMVKW